MVEKRETDGRRIAELLSSELTGHESAPYDAMAVTNADPDVEPTADGAHAYDVEIEGGDDVGVEGERDGERLASVFVQPERVRLELYAGLEAAEEAASDGGLRTRPVGSEPPRLVVFVESGVDAKCAFDVLGAAAR